MVITLHQLLWSGEECHCYVGAHRVADKEGSGSLVEEAEEELFTFFNEWIFPIIQVGYLDGGKVLFFVLLFISGHEGLPTIQERAKKVCRVGEPNQTVSPVQDI